MRDWRGTEIEVGSLIVYPTTSGSILTMNEAVVIDITTQKDRWPNDWCGGKPVLVVQKTIEHAFKHVGNSECSKAVKLTRVDRVTVIK